MARPIPCKMMRSAPSASSTTPDETIDRSMIGRSLPEDTTRSLPSAQAEHSNGSVTVGAPAAENLENSAASSSAVMSLMAGFSFAARTTVVPALRSSLTKGKIPRIRSAPALSAKTMAFLNLPASDSASAASSRQSSIQGRGGRFSRSALKCRSGSSSRDSPPSWYLSEEKWAPRSKRFPAKQFLRASSIRSLGVPGSASTSSRIGPRMASDPQFSFRLTCLNASRRPSINRHVSRTAQRTLQLKPRPPLSLAKAASKPGITLFGFASSLSSARPKFSAKDLALEPAVISSSSLAASSTSCILARFSNSGMAFLKMSVHAFLPVRPSGSGAS
mmetsp:Transcript_1718/g.5842  ORF Transcript_1718/g.5842 Transcript_1718/m.5842 type:complete len:332 (+) Transcript_1718:2020-3015(+)